VSRKRDIRLLTIDRHDRPTDTRRHDGTLKVSVDVESGAKRR